MGQIKADREQHRKVVDPNALALLLAQILHVILKNNRIQSERDREFWAQDYSPKLARLAEAASAIFDINQSERLSAILSLATRSVAPTTADKSRYIEYITEVEEQRKVAKKLIKLVDETITDKDFECTLFDMTARQYTADYVLSDAERELLEQSELYIFYRGDRLSVIEHKRKEAEYKRLKNYEKHEDEPYFDSHALDEDEEDAFEKECYLAQKEIDDDIQASSFEYSKSKEDGWPYD